MDPTRVRYAAIVIYVFVYFYTTYLMGSFRQDDFPQLKHSLWEGLAQRRPWLWYKREYRFTNILM